MTNELSNLKNLKLLIWLRSIAIIGQTIAILAVTRMLDIPLMEKPLWLIIVMLVLVNIAACLRARIGKDIEQNEFLLQLLTDMAALFGLLYYTGGATNPFATLFILQVIIAAVVLKPLYTWIVAALAVSLYTLLMFWNVEVPYFLHHHIGDFFNLHVQGMWISFMLLVGIVSWFIVRMNQTIYRQNTLLSEAEKMAALGSFAANSAHELGTPLATMAILAENLDGEMRHKFISHITRCKEIISQITAAGGLNRAEGGNKMALETFLKTLVEEWQSKNLAAKIQFEFNGSGNPEIIAEQSIKHALWNLLDNAFDASPEHIIFNANWTASKLHLLIQDKGDGIAKTIAESIGKAGITTKANGMGLGLFLTKSVITRLDGQIEIVNSKDGGVCCQILIPLKNIVL